MQIRIRLFATLREGRGKEILESVSETTTVMDIITQLNISTEDVAILLINGRDGNINQNLIEGDIISIFPPVGGG